MTAAEQYVAAAYLVVFVVVLAYVLIIATKLQRLERALEDVSLARKGGPDVVAPEEQSQAAGGPVRPGAVGAQAR